MLTDRRSGWMAQGLDLTNPDVTTQAEIDEFRRQGPERFGTQHLGLEFWLEERPDVLKRYRGWSDTLRIRELYPDRDSYQAAGLAVFISYARYDYQDGVKNRLVAMNRIFTKAEVLEVLALCFRYLGPRGMANVAKAAKEHTWVEPTQPARWPEGWKADPEAFRSGIDFSTPSLTDAEKQLLEDWYMRYLGEVPGHVKLLSRHRPEMLKAYRNRFENTLRIMPKQLEPSVMIQHSVENANPYGIREGVLLARGFGMSKLEVIEALDWGTFYGTVPVLDAAYQAVGDVLDAWED